MKYRCLLVMSVMAISILLSGCGTKGTDSESPPPSSSPTSPIPTESPAPKATETPKITLLEEFKGLALANVPADELFESLKNRIGEVPPAEADDFIRTLEAYYELNLPAVEKKFEDDQLQQELSTLDWPFTEEQIPNISDDKARLLVKQALAGGYKLEITEGYVFPIVDYSMLLSFGEQVTTSMKTYLELMALESNEKTASDGGLVISLDELSRRTLAAESYVVTFPETAERKKAEDRFIQYLSYYLIGLNNTPIFDYETFIVLPEVKIQYEQMATSHSGTVVGQLTEQMLLLLTETSGAVFSKSKSGEQRDIVAMKTFRDQLETKARSMLPEFKK